MSCQPKNGEFSQMGKGRMQQRNGWFDGKLQCDIFSELVLLMLTTAENLCRRKYQVSLRDCAGLAQLCSDGNSVVFSELEMMHCEK